jgi:hypothetical protein
VRTAAAGCGHGSRGTPSVNASQWIMVAAMLLGPILAVQIQKFLEARRELRRTRMSLFHTLMQTRGNRLDPTHVQALNSIDLLFHKDKKVVEAWRIYLGHLTSLGPVPTPSQIEEWVKRDEDYLVDLLAELSQVLGYDFDTVALKRVIHAPRAHAEHQSDSEMIRRSLVDILSGKQAIPVRLTDAPTAPAPQCSPTTPSDQFR